MLVKTVKQPATTTNKPKTIALMPKGLSEDVAGRGEVWTGHFEWPYNIIASAIQEVENFLRYHCTLSNLAVLSTNLRQISK